MDIGTTQARANDVCEYLTMKHVRRLLACSDRTILNRMKAGKFPKSVKDGRLHKWPAPVIAAYQASLTH